MTYYTPPQRNFDGSTYRQAVYAQYDAVSIDTADSHLWASRAMNAAKRAVKLLGDDLYDAVMANFSDAWFEARTWRDQAQAYFRLLDTYQRQPAAALCRLVEAFGNPDINPD